MREEHLFRFDNELIKYIKKEILKYVNEGNPNKVLYNYDRMTVEELTQETLLKLHRSTDPEDPVMNKAFVRRCSRFVCIDAYRRRMDVIDRHVVSVDDEQDIEDRLFLDEEEAFRDVNRDLMLENYVGRDKEVLLKLIEGYKNGETLESLGIPRMTYYTLLKKLRENILH
ncbi:hypothetical protein [Pseudoalteromonas phage vB_PtuP_Slicky01]|nr:hypothetical protein [Pseudoalteromonas phage vB_PtuP_Slicky01]